MISFPSFLRHPLAMPLVDIYGYGDDCVKGVVDPVSLGKPVFDERGQVLLVLD